MLFGSKQWNTISKQASHFKWGKEREQQTTPLPGGTCEILDPDESGRPSTFFLFLIYLGPGEGYVTICSSSIVFNTVL